MPLENQSVQAKLDAYSRVLAKVTGASLSLKIQQLRQSRSNDPVQQLQTEAIVELYDVVREMQDVTAPLFDVLLPHVSGARGAAAAQEVSNALHGRGVQALASSTRPIKFP